MFNTAREDGLASWFAVTQTLLIALTLWLIYSVAKAGRKPRAIVVGWLVLALFFTYMAIDDGAQIHERLGSTFKALREASGASLDFFSQLHMAAHFPSRLRRSRLLYSGLSLVRAK